MTKPKSFIEKANKSFSEEFFDKFNGLEDPSEVLTPLFSDIQAFWNKKIRKMVKEIKKVIGETCDEQTMPRVWNLDEETIKKFIKIFPSYEPKAGEEYQVGIVRGETWGALKIKLSLLAKLNSILEAGE